MKINERDFYWEFCCFELMENCYMQGLNPNWGWCPFCGQEFEYKESTNENEANNYDSLTAFGGDKDEMYTL